MLVKGGFHKGMGQGFRRSLGVLFCIFLCIVEMNEKGDLKYKMKNITFYFFLKTHSLGACSQKVKHPEFV